MHSLEILLSIWIISSYFALFAQAQGIFAVVSVTYIKEIQYIDDNPNLEDNIFADTEEKRLELCRGGLKKIKNDNKPFWSLKGKDVDLKGVTVERLKVYFFKYEGDFRIRATMGYKCLTEPEIYISADTANGYDNQPVFYVIILKKENLRQPTSKQILYQLARVIDIVQVNPVEMLSISKSLMGIPAKIPSYDTDEFSEEQRLKLCIKGTQLSPELNVELLKDTKTSKNKFYKTTTFARFFKDDQQIIGAFECPTRPKIFITAFDQFSMLVLIRTIDGRRITLNGEKLKAISDETTTAEDLYHQIKNESADTKRDQVLDPRMQYKMCRQIFLEKKYIDFYNVQILPICYIEAYDELKTTNPTLCTHFYNNEGSSIIPGKDIIIIRNGPESADVMVSKTQKNSSEDVFACLIQYSPGNYKEYFFSKEYNMNPSKEFPGYIAGRFVFKRSPNNNSIVTPVLAMIQQFAEILETSNVELLYLERRRNQDLAKMDSDDRLCKLDNLERSKICALIFPSTNMTTPLHELGCAKNPITLITEDGKKEGNGGRYYEWMLPCCENTRDNVPIKIYYLSQAYTKSDSSSTNDVFAYSRTYKSAQVILENAYTDPRIGLFSKNK